MDTLQLHDTRNVPNISEANMQHFYTVRYICMILAAYAVQ